MNLLSRLFTWTIFIFLFSCNTALKDNKNGAFDSAKITMDKSDQAPSQIRFQKSKEVPIENFWKEYSQRFNLSVHNTFEIFKTLSDNTAQNHHRYKQYYEGVEVADMQYILHEKNDLVYLANGKIVHGLDINITPSISESRALEKAFDKLGAPSKRKSNPKARLMISSTGKPGVVQNFKLVYRFDIYSQEPSSAYTVDVDAHTGEILNKVSLIMTEKDKTEKQRR